MTDCKTCWGYGLRADCGAPIGALAVQDDVPTLRCPECGANGNPHLHAKVSAGTLAHIAKIRRWRRVPPTNSEEAK